MEKLYQGNQISSCQCISSNYSLLTKQKFLLPSPLLLFTAKPTPSSPGLWHPHQSSRRKRNRQQKTSFSSDTHPHPGPSSILLSDATMTPWGRLALSESCFDSIPKILTPRPSPPPPPASPVPEQIPSVTPYHGRRQEEDKDSSGSSFNSQIQSPPVAVTQNSAGMTTKRDSHYQTKPDDNIT